MWYIGNEFNKKENKTYKTLEGGLKAAKKQNLNLYDEKGKIVYLGVAERDREQQEEVEIRSEERRVGKECM